MFEFLQETAIQEQDAFARARVNDRNYTRFRILGAYGFLRRSWDYAERRRCIAR